MSERDFQDLILSNAESLKPYAFGLTRDTEKAKDLCQETMYKAFAYKNNYQPGTNIKAWLYTIMRNIFINDFRRNSRKTAIYKQIQYQYNYFESSSESSIRYKEIQEVLYNMPSIFKTSCILYLQGYKYQEIAFVLNEPLGTIKSRIHLAKKLMQKRLDR
jgi:RNA polymerase sigma factor (sigma-70 family)